MNYRILIISSVALAVVSCNKTEVEQSHCYDTSLYAEMASGEAKTVLQDDGKTLWWSPGDEIKVFYGDRSARFSSQNTEPSGRAEFKGVLDVQIAPDSEIWATYPYSADVTFSEGTLFMSVPSEQKVEADIFPSKTFPSVARTTSSNLTFYNVCGGLKFSVVNDNIASIRFAANGGESIVGDMDIRFGEDGKSVAAAGKQTDSVLTIIPSDHVYFRPLKTYYAVLQPSTLSSGFTMTFETADSYARRATDIAVKVSRSRFGVLPMADLDLEFKQIEHPVDSIRLSDDNIYLGVDEKYQLKAYVFPENATDRTIQWTSSNRAVAAIDDNGLVTALGAGESTITASTKNGMRAECKVGVPSISLSSSELTIEKGTTSKLTATVLPDDLPDKSVTWSSSDASVASVDDDGNVSGVGVGSCTITATTKNGLKAECKVSVFIPVTGISLSSTELILEKGKLATLTATILPSDATDQSITWSSSDSYVASVDNEGNVTGVGVGSCIITVTAKDGGKTADCTVNVWSISVTGVSLNESNVNIVRGATCTLIATIAPSDASDKTVTWSSSNSSIATVSFDGVVTGKSVGEAIITATTNDGGKTANCIIEVMQLPELPELVDLGLSVKWRGWNVGASKPEEYGTYFAWGDVVGQTWNGSSWSGGGFSTEQAYELDENGNLKPEYDAAHVNLGGTWRMPTEAEQQELIDNCTSTWTNDYEGTGVAGRIFTSNKEGYTDKFIFLPAAGMGFHDAILYGGFGGDYWSSTFRYVYARLAFGSGYVFTYGLDDRSDGFSVRPVTE